MTKRIGTGLSLLMLGRYAAALSAYNARLRTGPDPISQAEMMCALAGLKPKEAEPQVHAYLRQADLDPRLAARYLTADAFVKLGSGQSQEAIVSLRRAQEADPRFPLAQLSLGRHALWAKRDFAAAREHIGNAQHLAEDPAGPDLNMMALEVEAGNYKEARRIGWGLLKRSPTILQGWTMLADTWLISTPLKGRVALIVSIVLVLIPYVGPLVPAAWALLAIASLLTIRRMSPRLALLPWTGLMSLLAVLLLKVLFLRRLFP